MRTVGRIAEHSLKGIRGTDFFSATRHCVIKMLKFSPSKHHGDWSENIPPIFSNLLRRSYLNLWQSVSSVRNGHWHTFPQTPCDSNSWVPGKTQSLRWGRGNKRKQQNHIIFCA